MNIENSLIIRNTIRQIFRVRQFQAKKVSEFSKTVKKKSILEIGSGKQVQGRYPYSFRNQFDKSNKFLMTDYNKSFGHKYLDVTDIKLKSKFDIILCLNVLEHVYDYQLAISNLYKCLEPGGTLIISVPYIYPLHDEPIDFWRFSEHSLKQMFSNFKTFRLSHLGLRKFPIAYYLELIK